MTSTVEVMKVFKDVQNNYYLAPQRRDPRDTEHPGSSPALIALLEGEDNVSTHDANMQISYTGNGTGTQFTNSGVVP